MATKFNITNPSFETEADRHIGVGEQLTEADEAWSRALNALEAVTTPLTRKGVHVPERNVKWREDGSFMMSMAFCEDDIREMASPALVNDLLLQYRGNLAERVRLGLKELDAACDEAERAWRELKDQIIDTPASSLAGVLIKLNDITSEADAWLLDSIQSDLERLG